MKKEELRFRHVKQKDIKMLDSWYNEINGKEYLSRATPKKYDETKNVNGNDFIWWIVSVNEEGIGTIWFEKEESIK